jgi:tRNA/rRNA methyltransferase
MPAPSVVLVRPQMGENIGAAARAMMNFGLSDLRLVAPRDGWPNAKAAEMAAHATHIIEQARVYDSLQTALADRQVAMAATARSRQMYLPAFLPDQAVEQMRSARAAFVFGPENNGLSNEDVALCQGIVTIPTHPDNASLNIAQSVVLLAYQWFVMARASSCAVKSDELLADNASVEALFTHLDAELEQRKFYKTEQLKPLMQRNLRALLSRASLSVQEVKTLRGVITVLTRR